MQVTGDQQLLKQLNRMAVVRQVSTQPGLSRAALADVLGLTKAGISLLVRALVDEGWLTESELLVTGEVGRRATPLHLDPSRLALLGAELGVDEARVVATNLLGEVLDTRILTYEDPGDPTSCIRLAALALAKLAKRLGRPVLGVGIGLHGAVDEALGLLHHAPHLGWRDVDVAGIVQAHTKGSPLDGLPLYMQNEANVAALGEFEFGDQASTDPLIYLSIGYGVGAGVIVNDRLLTGLRGFAGEAGHAILQAGGPLCSCGRRGCADALIGLGALLGAELPSHPALDRLFRRVVDGDPATCAAVDAAGRQLGVLLNNLWASFDPMAIVIGGPAVRLGDTLIEPARRVLGEYADAAMLTAPEIRTSRFGADVVAVGGAALARHRLTRPLDLQSMARRADKAGRQARATNGELGLAR